MQHLRLEVNAALHLVHDLIAVLPRCHARHHELACVDAVARVRNLNVISDWNSSR